MTNIIYVIRDDESCASSRLEEEESNIAEEEEPTEEEIDASMLCLGIGSSNLRSFPLKELEIATKNFDPSNLLGEGPFASVFKGRIDKKRRERGIVVAVKRLHEKKRENATDWLGLIIWDEWSTPGHAMLKQADINYLGKFYHPNLVKIVGYCNDKLKYLVYEFMPMGSLEDHLFKSRGVSNLSWSLLAKIILQSAKCLAFLHKNKAIHGNFKPSNILLDSNYNAQLSFGEGKDYATGIETIRGVQEFNLDFVSAYTDPECFHRGLTATSDVYSFGVVLLVILFGRRLVDPDVKLDFFTIRETCHFVALANTLEGRCRLRGAQKDLYDLALLCLTKPGYSTSFRDKVRRITMDKVVIALESVNNRIDVSDAVSDNIVDD